jgi:hypothetical protein
VLASSAYDEKPSNVRCKIKHERRDLGFRRICGNPQRSSYFGTTSDVGIYVNRRMLQRSKAAQSSSHGERDSPNQAG